MKVLGVGVNPSDREPEHRHFDSDSPPDPTVRETFKFVFGEGNYKFTDLIETRDSKLLHKTKEELIQLCKDNEKKFIEEIKEYKPDLIVFLFKDKRLIEFIFQLKEKYNFFPKMIFAYQPTYIYRRKGWKSEQYKRHIEKELEKVHFKLFDINSIELNKNVENNKKDSLENLMEFIRKNHGIFTIIGVFVALFSFFTIYEEKFTFSYPLRFITVLIILFFLISLIISIFRMKEVGAYIFVLNFLLIYFLILFFGEINLKFNSTVNKIFFIGIILTFVIFLSWLTSKYFYFIEKYYIKSLILGLILYLAILYLPNFVPSIKLLEGDLSQYMKDEFFWSLLYTISNYFVIFILIIAPSLIIINKVLKYIKKEMLEMIKIIKKS